MRILSIIIFHVFYYRRQCLTTNRFKYMTISQNTHFHNEHQFNRHRTHSKWQTKINLNVKTKKKFHRIFFSLVFFPFLFVAQLWLDVSGYYQIEMSLNLLFTPQSRQNVLQTVTDWDWEQIFQIFLFFLTKQTGTEILINLSSLWFVLIYSRQIFLSRVKSLKFHMCHSWTNVFAFSMSDCRWKFIFTIRHQTKWK